MKPRLLAAAALAALSSGCFNDSSSMTPALQFVAAGDGFDIPAGATSAAVFGAFFTPSTTVFWNGQAVPTVFQDGSRLSIALDPSLTDQPGTARVTATNPDSFPSKPLKVTISEGAPNVSDLSPRQAPLNADALSLTVTGTRFRPDSLVLWNGAALQTTYLHAGSLTAAVPVSLLATAGDGFVQVVNPPSGSYTSIVSNVVPFEVGTSTRGRVPRVVSDVAWDAATGTLYVSAMRSDARSRIQPPSVILVVDPVTATAGVVRETPGFDVQLSISDQGRFLYTGGLTAGPPMRYALPAMTDAVTIWPSAVTAVVPAPGTPSTAALLFSGTGAPGTAGVIDDTVLRPKVFSQAMTAAAWGFDASRLYGGVIDGTGIDAWAVDSTGVVSRAAVFNGCTLDGSFQYDRVTRRLYSGSGCNMDEQGNLHGRFALPVDLVQTSNYTSNCAAAGDGAGGKVFFACLERDIGLTLWSFDANTSAPIARVLLQPAPAFSLPRRIVRWGPDGLAIATNELLLLYRGPFVH